MKLGIKDFKGKNLKETIDKIKRLGFKAVGVPYVQLIKGLNLSLDDKNVQDRVKSAFSNLKIAELGVYTNLIHSDARVRERNIEYTKHVLRFAPKIDCPLVVTGSGSLSPQGDWFAHPENYSSKTWGVLVKSLKEVMKTAEECDVFLGLEPHTVTPLSSVERLQKIIMDVKSRKLGINMDPVNLITYDTYFHTGKFLNYMSDVLGNYIVGIHVKDVHLENRLIIHLDETYPGNGNLDYETYLRRMKALSKGKDLCFLIEHTEESLIPKAKEYVEEIARKVGLVFE